jgi:hypothetical protein
MYKERSLAELKKHPNNPRFIRDKQFNALVESIRDNVDYFKARPLILSNRTGELIIIAGNQRYEAAKQLKMAVVPTFLLENLTEERENEIMIRDNVNNGEWDFEMLANEWDTGELYKWGFDSLPYINAKGEEPKKLFYELSIAFTQEQATRVKEFIKQFSKTKQFTSEREKAINKNINGLSIYMAIRELTGKQKDVQRA